MSQLNRYQVEWLEELETTSEPQGYDRLVTVDWEGNISGYCCLGIAAKKQGVPHDTMLGHMGLCNEPELDAVCENLCLRGSEGVVADQKITIGDRQFITISGINDSTLFSFKDIATIIRNNPEVFFTNFD